MVEPHKRIGADGSNYAQISQTASVFAVNQTQEKTDQSILRLEFGSLASVSTH